MRKSLVLLAAALLIAVGAAGTHRLRYDSSVFTGRGELTQTRPKVVREYPPCIKGVREDSCIQLYERGVRRSYARWRAEHGLSSASAERTYRPCRSRSDDRCQQRSARNRVRTARARGPVRTARQGQQRAVARSRQANVRRAAAQRQASRATVRRSARRPAATTRAATRAPARTTARPPARAAARAPAQATPRRQQPATPAPRQSAPPRQQPLPNTPGI